MIFDFDENYRIYSLLDDRIVYSCRSGFFFDTVDKTVEVELTDILISEWPNKLIVNAYVVSYDEICYHGAHDIIVDVASWISNKPHWTRYAEVIDWLNSR